VTSTLVFEGEGQISEYVGGYDDWLRQRKPNMPVKAEKTPAKAEKSKPRRNGPQKMSYKGQCELEALPQRIEEMEEEQQQLYQTMADPTFYQQGGGEIAKAKDRLKALEQELDATYQRWEELM